MSTTILIFKKIIEQKLALGYLLIISVLVIFGIATMQGLFTLGSLTRTIYEHPLVVSNASLNAAMNITKMHRNMKDVVLTSSPAEREADLMTVSEAGQAVYRQLDIIQQKILGDEGQALAKQARQLFVDWTPIRKEVVRLLESGNKQEATVLTKGKEAEHVAALEDKMLELTSYARNKAAHFMEQAIASQSRLENIISWTITCIVLSIFIGFFATRRVLRAEKDLRDEKSKLQKALAERKRAEEDLRASQSTLENVFNNINPLCITSLNYEVLIANEAYYALYPKSKSQEGRIRCYESRPGSLCESDLCPLKQAFQGKEEITVESTKHFNHQEREFIISARPFRDANGKLAGIVESFQDITDRKVLEKEKEELIEKLQASLKKVKLLSGFLPICASCKKIRDDNGYWRQIEAYIRTHSEAEFSHGICPDCYKKLYPDFDLSHEKKEGK